MQSYVQNPQIHAQAVKDPKLLGGPFIDLQGQNISEISEMIEYTKNECKKLIELNSALKEIDKLLQNEAKGYSLEEFYNRIPEPLKGMIELVYDLNNHPSVRLIEPFIYKKYYNSSSQQIAISHINNDFRNFVLSTPRIENENELRLDIPFYDKRLDYLFSLKKEPQPIENIIETFNIVGSKQNLFKSFFTTTIPSKSPDNNYYDEGVRIRYFGHACILVQTKEISILFDPVISYSYEGEIDRYTFNDLPDHIDYVVITHNHQDHLMFETLLQLRHKIGNIIFPSNRKGELADPSIKLILEYTGFSSLIEFSELSTFTIKDGIIIGLPFFGEHSDLNIQSKLSYFINIKNNKLLFAADSNNLDKALYDNIYNITGAIDMLFIGMECNGAPLSWLYGPLLSSPISRSCDRSRTLSGSDFNKAWSIAEKLQCKQAYIYAMGQEPWLNYVMALNYLPDSPQILESNKFIEACHKANIKSERLLYKREWIIT